MYHSDYMATKFEVWTSVGQKKLKTMIAQLGISLKAAEQMYYHMPPQAKRDLRERVVETGKEFGLNDINYGSFHLRTGYRFHLSAADAVYGIMAVLGGYGREGPAGEDAWRES